MDDTPITPLAVPSEARTLIVFGGTFDPPHLGHVKPAVEARTLAGLHDAWMVYVPAARSPHKSSGPVFSDARRVDLLRLALAEIDHATIWTDELERGGGAATYTIDTLRRLRRTRPDAALRLLIGADQALALHRWREPREIVALAPPLIMLRGGLETSIEELMEHVSDTNAWNKDELETLRSGVVRVHPVTASATAIRAALASGNLDPVIHSMLHPVVSLALQSNEHRNR